MRKKQNVSLKMQIVSKFIVSAIYAFITTFAIMMGGLLLLEYLFHDTYERFITWYNSDFVAGAVVLVVIILIMMIGTFCFFMWKMNTITNEISSISEVIHLLSDGKLENRIKHISNNELGKLAQDVNIMAEQLQMSVEKERQWNEERYNMITNMSHDLKTPMMSVMGYADMIANGKYANQQELEAYCRIISDKTIELNVVVKQLFELSKFSSYDYSLQKVKINVAQFAEQVAMTFIPQLEGANMELRLYIQPTMEITADLQALKSVFENLMTNAIKYASGGHYLDIYGEQKEIVFKNYGPFIEEKELDKLFHKFYREKKSDGIEGSGCGLFIIKQIMELHGGRIYVESSKESTEFHLVFKE